MSVTAPQGFSAAGVSSGIKASGALDLALVCTEDGSPVPAAATFTTNLAAAAPVRVSRMHLSSTGAMASAVVLSSGNANAATGERGIDDAKEMCGSVAKLLGSTPEEVLICQTGLIGIPLPMEVIRSGIPRLVAERSADEIGGRAAASAIMTTDTVSKQTHLEVDGWVVGGMAKGAAMLAPNMATMLAVLTTDAGADPGMLGRALRAAVANSFNKLTVDGSTSTNDTVIVLANGRSGVAPSEAGLSEILGRACDDLALQMACDAEGATKVVHVIVKGAQSDEEAHRAARRIADTLLVKCSLNGEDPYWGRVVSELGSAGVDLEIDRVDVSYGGVTVCRGGVAAEHDEVALRDHMAGSSIEIVCDLDIGNGSSVVLGTDLGHGYIDENRTTS